MFQRCKVMDNKQQQKKVSNPVSTELPTNLFPNYFLSDFLTNHLRVETYSLIFSGAIAASGLTAVTCSVQHVTHAFDVPPKHHGNSSVRIAGKSKQTRYHASRKHRVIISASPEDSCSQLLLVSLARAAADHDVDNTVKFFFFFVHRKNLFNLLYY